MAAKDKDTSAKTCFVIMPISDQPHYSTGHFSRVYEDVIKPAIVEAGYRPVRADEVRATNLIHLDILRQLLNADLALCDLSSLNPNVMFELGIRQAFDKPVVLVKDDITRGPFDISPIRYAEYDSSLSYRGVIKAREELKNTIAETVQGSSAGEVNSIVRLLGLQAAALTASDQKPEDARFSLIEQSLSALASQVSSIARSLAPPTSPTAAQGALSMANLRDMILSPQDVNVRDYLTAALRKDAKQPSKGILSSFEPDEEK